MRIWQTEMILFSFFTEKGVRSVLTFLVHKNFCENASGCIQNMIRDTGDGLWHRNF